MSADADADFSILIEEAALGRYGLWTVDGGSSSRCQAVALEAASRHLLARGGRYLIVCRIGEQTDADELIGRLSQTTSASAADEDEMADAGEEEEERTTILVRYDLAGAAVANGWQQAISNAAGAARLAVHAILTGAASGSQASTTLTLEAEPESSRAACAPTR